MPISSIKKSQGHTYAMWHIEENLDWFLRELNPTQEELQEINRISHIHRKKQNISARLLLNKLAKRKVKLNYLSNGSPYCQHFKNISISHSKDYCILIISDQNIGIDIQYQKKNITTLKDKFINKKEFERLKKPYTLEDLHFIWCVKEAVYKSLNNPSCSLKDDIYVLNLEDKKSAYYLNDNRKKILFTIDYQKLGSYFITIAKRNHDRSI